MATKFYSSRLLPYVESVEINGELKTVFYSEFNMNLNVGDRLFVVDGPYDIWNQNTVSIYYSPYAAGYDVLSCVDCRIVLDLPYTGVLPSLETKAEEFINVWHIRSQREFDYINSIKVYLKDTDVDFPTFSGLHSKFSGFRGTFPTGDKAVLYTNSIIYVDSAFLGSANPENINSGVNAPGFWVRLESATPLWQNITDLVISNSFYFANSKYPNQGYLFVIGEDFTYQGVLYKQRGVHSFTANNIWEIDTRFNPCLVSKLNFRNGNFLGRFNDGIYGTTVYRIDWDGGEWYSGILLNARWLSGDMLTKSEAGERRVYATLQDTAGGTQSYPVETVDFSDNRGYGFNFVYNSQVLAQNNIMRAVFENTNFGTTSLDSAIDIYYGLTGSLGTKVANSFFYLCDLDSVEATNCLFLNSRITNSKLSGSKIVNSQVFKSVADECEFDSRNGLRILAADLWSYRLDGRNRGVLKLFISDDDLQKVVFSDSIYLTKLNKDLVLTNGDEYQRVHLPIEAKYILDLYLDDEISGGKIFVHYKDKRDNLYSHFVLNNGGNYTLNSLNNSNYYASIDIDCEELSWERNQLGQIRYHPNYLLGSVEKNQVSKFFENQYIRNSEFKSGIFANSTWLDGDHINYGHHKVRNVFGLLDISYIDQTTIRVGLNLNAIDSNTSLVNQDLFVGDTVWINSLDMIDGATITPIGGRYKVITIQNTPTIKYINLQNQENLQFIPTATFGSTNVGANSYFSINQFLINDSTINAGLFRRAAIRGSSLENKLFDSTDRNLNYFNISQLRVINQIFKDSDNTVSAGLVYKSHFVNDTWTNGILFNSIWNGGIFRNGTLKKSFWFDGIFNNGLFYESHELTPRTWSQNSNFDFDFTMGTMWWLNGTFNGGEFFRSVWNDGTFNNGRLYHSDWYSGTWNNGILGSKTLPENFTTMGSKPGSQITNFFDGVAENALVGGLGRVYWYGGIFENGEFTSEGATPPSESIWYDGEFKGGKITGLARWVDGDFYNGKFHSFYGWTFSSPTNPSTFSTNYSWQGGIFRGGEFGNANYTQNSTWFGGLFLGGIFSGRFWYDGLFNRGLFVGSGTPSTYNSRLSPQEEYDFANSFTYSYYGLWFNGIVTDQPQNFSPIPFVPEVLRTVEDLPPNPIAAIDKILWMNGTFSHDGGSLKDSLWLSGNFYKGRFDSGVFNPYVDRTFAGNTSSSQFGSQSIWHGGVFASRYGLGSFYISEWKDGLFEDGYMSGAVWRNGIWQYGTAENIYWEYGTWKNGNWNGSPYNYTHLSAWTTSNAMSVPAGRERDIIINIVEATGLPTIHLINAFSASYPGSLIYQSDGSYNGWQFGADQYTQGIIGYNGQNQPILGNMLASLWGSTTQFTDSHRLGTTLVDTNMYSAPIVINPLPQNAFNTLGYNRNVYTYVPPSISLYAIVNNSTSVFTQSAMNYQINLRLSVELEFEVGVLFGLGNELITRTFSSNLDFYGTASGIYADYNPRIYEFNLNYTTGPDVNNNPTETTFYIKKVSGGIVRILNAEIIQRKIGYHPTYNNTLWLTGINNSVILPNDPHLWPTATNNIGQQISINFGNGFFRAGIWESGVWLNGWRSSQLFEEKDYSKFDNVIGIGGLEPTNDDKTIQLSDTTWNIAIRAAEPITCELHPGDKVSIGNIIAIDINEERRLLKDPFTIVRIDEQRLTMVVSLTTNIQIRRIERDSDRHLIYVTKNIWLSGVFLNGFFRGVWNSGLFKGFPAITYMQDSHFIDGILDGGRFSSTKDLHPLTGLDYHTGLVQNFSLFVNNRLISGQEKFLSWMDINYHNLSRTNINNFNSIFQIQNINGVSASYFVNETLRYGDPSYDVLSSLTYFNSLTTNELIGYRLGYKFKRYENLIPGNGLFERPFSNKIDEIGLDNFINDPLAIEPGLAWQINEFVGDLAIESNIDNPSARRLLLSATATSPYYWTRFENTNLTSLILRDRYYMVDALVDASSSIYATSAAGLTGTYVFLVGETASNLFTTNGYGGFGIAATGPSADARVLPYQPYNLNQQFEPNGVVDPPFVGNSRGIPEAFYNNGIDLPGRFFGRDLDNDVYATPPPNRIYIAPPFRYGGFLFGQPTGLDGFSESNFLGGYRLPFKLETPPPRGDNDNVWDTVTWEYVTPAAPIPDQKFILEFDIEFAIPIDFNLRDFRGRLMNHLTIKRENKPIIDANGNVSYSPMVGFRNRPDSPFDYSNLPKPNEPTSQRYQPYRMDQIPGVTYSEPWVGLDGKTYGWRRISGKIETDFVSKNFAPLFPGEKVWVELNLGINNILFHLWFNTIKNGYPDLRIYNGQLNLPTVGLTSSNPTDLGTNGPVAEANALSIFDTYNNNVITIQSSPALPYKDEPFRIFNQTLGASDNDYQGGCILRNDISLFTFSGTLSNVFDDIINASQLGLTVSSYLTYHNFNLTEFGGTESTLAYNHLSHTERNKTEFFYNKSNLEMTIYLLNKAPNFSFEEISFWETDMIPLFRYASASQIDLSIQFPLQAAAPPIVPNNPNFSFIDNVVINLQTIQNTIATPATQTASVTVTTICQ